MRYLMLVGMLVCLSGCATWNKWYPADNIIEELAEEVIEAKTGLDLDLSPNSPEVK